MVSASRVKPLAHLHLQLDDLVKPETDMRPFLAFSVPPVALKEVQKVRMQNADWLHIQEAYAGNDRQRQELVGLEASKKAVVEIDHSFSLFNILSQPAPTTERQHAGGVFLGAERVSVGEAVRVRLGDHEIRPEWPKGLPVVMVLHHIFVANQGGEDKLYFHGDIYRLEESTGQRQPTHNSQLPPALLREKAFRDGARPSTGTCVDWVLVFNNITKDESAIRGRFYETSRLMVILAPDQFRQSMASGAIDDVQAYLNNHLDSTGEYIGRRKNRDETLAGAVPKGFSLSLGPNVIEPR